jgi:four helix bundle protein
MNLDSLEIYSLSLQLGKDVWEIVNKWDYFSKDTIGKQLIRAVDSIAANISEGYSRYHFKEELKFLFYARGSLNETRTFLTIANSRKLLTDEQMNELTNKIEILGKKLNSFINSIYKKLEKP